LPRPTLAHVQRGEPAMTSLIQSRGHSAPIRAEMKALDLRRRRVPLGAVLVSVVIGVNTVSVVAMLIGL
jgi:hypothetical protein